MSLYSSIAVANYFIGKALNEEDPKYKKLTPMKLVKLVYYAHGVFLAVAEKPLIKDPIEAWSYGPVIHKIYHEFKKYGRDNILEKAEESIINSDLDYPDNYLNSKREVPEIPNDDVKTLSLLDEVWTFFKKFTGVQLSNMTHQPDTPWSDIKRKYNGNIFPNEVISNSSIKEYFEKKLRINENG